MNCLCDDRVSLTTKQRKKNTLRAKPQQRSKHDFLSMRFVAGGERGVMQTVRAGRYTQRALEARRVDQLDGTGAASDDATVGFHEHGAAVVHHDMTGRSARRGSVA